MMYPKSNQSNFQIIYIFYRAKLAKIEIYTNAKWDKKKPKLIKGGYSRLGTILKKSRYQVAQLSTLRHSPKSLKNPKISQIIQKLKLPRSFKVYL